MKNIYKITKSQLIILWVFTGILFLVFALPFVNNCYIYNYAQVPSGSTTVTGNFNFATGTYGDSTLDKLLQDTNTQPRQVTNYTSKKLFAPHCDEKSIKTKSVLPVVVIPFFMIFYAIGWKNYRKNNSLKIKN